LISAKLQMDERTKEWPLMNPVHMLLVSAGYIIFVVLGKSFTKDAEKMELRTLRILHNFAMTAVNLYICCEMIRQCMATQWYGPILRDQRGLGMARVIWVYYISKVFEFLDTVIMVFRKSYHQISFLHVYHHATVLMIWWFNTLYYPGGEAWISAWMNSFVHVWLYSYYLISSFNIDVWWKRYLTQMQIGQLSVFVIQGISLLWTGSKEFVWIGLLNGIYASTLLFLFLNFYSKSYSKKPTKEE